MEGLSTSDVTSLMAILAAASNPSVEKSLATRQRELIRGLQGLVSADAWLWFAGEVHSPTGASDLSSGLLYEGFDDADDPIEVFQSVCRPLIQAAFMPKPMNGCAHAKEDLFGARESRPTDQCSSTAKGGDIAGGDHVTVLECIQCVGTYRGVSLHRRRGRSPFSRRDRALAQMLFQHVDWLHAVPDEAVMNGGLLPLSPREREVMHLLLTGKSRKEVATQLGLSMHTVSDYLKQIYSKLKVTSRAELLAKFIPQNR